MLTIFLVIDVILAVMLVALVLVQRSDGALGSIGGGASSIMSTRSKGNFLTRTTAIVAAGFMACSLVLCIISKPEAKADISVLDSVPEANEVSVPVADMEVDVETEVETAKQGVENKVEEEIGQAKNAIKQETSEIEAAAKETVAKVEEKVKSAAEQAEQKISETVNNSVNKAENAASQSVNEAEADIRSGITDIATDIAKDAATDVKSAANGSGK